MQINSLNLQTDVSLPIKKTETPSETVKNEVQRELPSEPIESRKAEKLSELKSTLSEYNISLNFSRDTETNQLVVKLVDSTTGEAIRQTPSEVSLKLSAIYAQIQGNFVDARA